MDDRILSYLYCFNVEHDYFECHEYGESLWLDTGRPTILKGLIQAAVCIYHLEGGNALGGWRMWNRARKYLSDYLLVHPDYEGIDVQALVRNMDTMWESVPTNWRNQTMHRSFIEGLHLPRVRIQFTDPTLEERVLKWKVPEENEES